MKDLIVAAVYIAVLALAVGVFYTLVALPFVLVGRWLGLW